ncbi:MAG TPA: hypothetical protein VGS96_08775 [Thermoanaerobaculia bacterium]|jgi:hypothetical protein|nr:hypothetical protein [Thermoanaerobaculia bacterium]
MASLLAIVDPILQRLIQGEEEVRGLVVACSPSPLLERALLGSGVQHLRRCIVAVTSHRIVQIAVNRDLTLRDAVSQILYGDVRSVRFGRLRRTMTVIFRNGRKQRFTDLTFADIELLREIVPPLIGSSHPTPAKGREWLCGSCLAVLRRGSPFCPNCHTPMKRRDQAVKLAWWWPGGGYGYLGFPEMATLTAIVEAGLVVLFLIALASAMRFDSALAVVWLTIIFCHWKAAVAAHAGSLAWETQLDRDTEGRSRPTPADLVKTAVSTLRRLPWSAAARRRL